MVRDVRRDLGEQRAEWALGRRRLERRVTHGGADEQSAVLHFEAVQARDAVDVDEVPRPRQAERHGRHQALTAGQHAAVVARVLGEQRDGFLDGPGRVVVEWRGFHWLDRSIGLGAMRFNAPSLWRALTRRGRMDGPVVAAPWPIHPSRLGLRPSTSG